MRYRSQFAPNPDAIAEASAAAVAATQALAQVQAQGMEVTKVSKELRGYRERNGFAELLNDSMRRRHK
jgi:hypothetical protein